MADTDPDTPAKPEERAFPLPPASFEFLAESLRLQAEMQMGLMRLGADQEKTRGNLNLEEQRLLENSLTLLRFRYVQAVDEAKKKTA